ncbi:MAG: LacI family DNA-binding transcriptional regulator [Spirochaetota bacterium]
MGKVTIHDVAERAGVSTSTVSRSFHNHPRISDETKRRVLRAAQELNYTWQEPPDSLVLKSLGVLLPHSSDDLLLHPFFPLVMRGVSLHAQSRGYVTTYGFSGEMPDRLRLLEQFVATASVRGIVLLAAYQEDPCVDYLLGEHVPFVVIGRPEHAGDVLWVDNDNFHAMYDVVNRLIQAGCRRIAFLGGAENLNVTHDRLEGYRMALGNRGIGPDARLVRYAGGFSESDGYRAMVELLAPARPDGVVATDDLLALGALKALSDSGLGQLPCVGFNNCREAREHVPSLSSVEIRPEELGRHAARLVIERMETGTASEDHVIVPTLFVGRETTGHESN